MLKLVSAPNDRGQSEEGYAVFDDARCVGHILRTSQSPAVHPARHWPRLKVVVRCGAQHFRPRLSGQPRLELIGAQQHRHPVVVVANELVGLGDGSETVYSLDVKGAEAIVEYLDLDKKQGPPWAQVRANIAAGRHRSNKQSTGINR
jgi:hypothetical protein